MACWVRLRSKIEGRTNIVAVNLDHVKMIETWGGKHKELNGNKSLLIFNNVHDGYDFLHVVETQEAILKEMSSLTADRKSMAQVEWELLWRLILKDTEQAKRPAAYHLHSVWRRWNGEDYIGCYVQKPSVHSDGGRHSQSCRQ